MRRREDLVRAVAAALCLEMERVFEPVRDWKVVDSLLLGGGAAKGEVFCRLLATLFAPLPVYRAEGSEWMGAQGCLYPHDPRLARVAARRVQPLRGRDLPELVRARALYREFYRRLYGDFDAGRPYRCGRPS